MPLTIPTHPAAVLPLKLWRPHWFSGTALTIGAIAPDLAYPLDGSGFPVWPFSHTVPGLVGWCLPLTLVGCYLVRRAAPVVAAHGPGVLRGYGAIAAARHPWWVTVSSGLIGAASHLVLDHFDGFLPRPVELVSHALGALTLLAVLLVIARGDLLRRWYGDAPPRARRPLLFWGVTAVIAVPAAAITPFLPAAFLLHTTGVRLLCAAAGALLVAAAAVTLLGRPAQGRPPCW